MNDATRWSASPRWLFAALVAIYFVLTTLYGLATPVFEGYDGQAHYRAATFYRSELSLPALTPETVPISYELITQPPLYHALAGLAASGWPIEPALQLAAASVNVYFDKSLSYRQSVIPLDPDPAALAPAWIARFVSMLGGLLTLLGTWWLARVLFPRQLVLAVAAASIATFNPQFLYMSISITNDAWSAGTAALALAVTAAAALGDHKPRWWLWVGLAFALAGLTKYSALLVAAPMAVLWLFYLRRQGWRAALRGALWAAAGFAALAGWWYLRNLLLYGEIVPFERMATVLPTMRRVVPYSWERTFEHIPWLVASYWGIFLRVFAPGWYLDATRWFMIVGLLGLLPALRWLWQRRDPGLAVVYLALLPWLLIVGASVLHWTRTIEFGEQGRLASIAAAAFGVALAVGWAGWLPTRWRTGVHWLLTAFMLCLALAGYSFLRDGFALPPVVAAPLSPDRPLDATFADGMRLVGVDFPQGTALVAGASMPLTLYFTTDRPITVDDTLFLHLADDQNNLLFQFDGVAQQGGHPTRQWIPGQIFADTYSISVPADVDAGLATLSLGFYPVTDKSLRQPVYDRNGQELGDRLILATVRLIDADAPPPATTDAPVATWVNGIALQSAALVTDAAGAPLGVALDWTTTATLHDDYTVFVQVLDGEDRILAQVDRQPQDGQAPTSTWRAGDTLTDTIAWDRATAQWARIIVGLYGGDGQRLAVTAPAGAGDAVEIATR